MKESNKILIRGAKGKSNRRLVKCQEDEEEQHVVVRGEAEDALFEEYGGAPEEDELLWVGPSS